MPEPLDLELGAGFTETPLDETVERVVFVRMRRNLLHGEIVAASANLENERVIGELPGDHLPAGAIGASRDRHKIFAADESGIWEFSLDGGAADFVTGPPELPSLTVESARDAFGHESPALSARAGRPLFHWLLEVNRTGDTLYSYCSQQGRAGALVAVGLQDRSISAAASVAGFCAGIRANIDHNVVALPQLHRGPQVLDLHGKVCGVLRDVAPETASRSFAEADIHPSDGGILLAEADGGLWLWDWKRKGATRIANDGQAPTYGSDGTIYFMRTSAELWRLEPGGSPEPVARASGHVGGTEWQRRRSWMVRPKLSPDGRYLLAQFSVIGRATSHSMVMIDLQQRRIEQAPGQHHHSIAWF